jgi:hypothetical protein
MRKIYLAIIPFLIPALAVSWIFTPYDNDPTSLVTIVLAIYDWP